jgi:hypothetical protein
VQPGAQYGEAVGGLWASCTADRATASRLRTARRPFARDAADLDSLRPPVSFRSRVGRAGWSALTFPLVTGSAVDGAKIVKVFEFHAVSCAPSRIRTCAHGSGDRSLSGRDTRLDLRECGEACAERDGSIAGLSRPPEPFKPPTGRRSSEWLDAGERSHSCSGSCPAASRCVSVVAGERAGPGCSSAASRGSRRAARLRAGG